MPLVWTVQGLVFGWLVHQDRHADAFRDILLTAPTNSIAARRKDGQALRRWCHRGSSCFSQGGRSGWCHKQETWKPSALPSGLGQRLVGSAAGRKVRGADSLAYRDPICWLKEFHLKDHRAFCWWRSMPAGLLLRRKSCVDKYTQFVRRWGCFVQPSCLNGWVVGTRRRSQISQ